MHWIRIKQSKHIAVAYPLVTLLLCLGDPVVFLNNFGPHMEQLYKHLRDKNNMFMALDCLHHVLRFYMSVHGNSQPPNRVWDYLDSVTAQLLTIPQERVMLTGMKTDAPPKVKEIAKWKSLKNGHFDCPLTGKAEELLKSKTLMEYIPKMPDSDCINESDGGNKHLCKASSHEDSDDNYLYYPSAVDIKSSGVKHFKSHWSKGEPVVVSNVLSIGLGLSWEHMVMWRAFR
ncbi:furry homolog-like protein [Tanacetum coccineum]